MPRMDPHRFLLEKNMLHPFIRRDNLDIPIICWLLYSIRSIFTRASLWRWMIVESNVTIFVIYPSCVVYVSRALRSRNTIISTGVLCVLWGVGGVKWRFCVKSHNNQYSCHNTFTHDGEDDSCIFVLTNDNRVFSLSIRMILSRVGTLPLSEIKRVAIGCGVYFAKSISVWGRIILGGHSSSWPNLQIPSELNLRCFRPNCLHLIHIILGILTFFGRTFY